MRLSIKGHIPVSEYGFLEVAYEVEDVASEYGSIEAARTHLIGLYEADYREHSERPMAKDVRAQKTKATPEQVKKLEELADITHMHDQIGDMAKLSSYQASRYIERLQEIVEKRKQEVKEERKTTPKQSRK